MEFVCFWCSGGCSLDFDDGYLSVLEKYNSGELRYYLMLRTSTKGAIYESLGQEPKEREIVFTLIKALKEQHSQ